MDIMVRDLHPGLKHLTSLDLQMEMWKMENRNLKSSLESLDSKYQSESSILSQTRSFRSIQVNDSYTQTEVSEIQPLADLLVDIRKLRQESHELRVESENAIKTQRLFYEDQLRNLGPKLHEKFSQHLCNSERQLEEQLNTARAACRQQLANEISKLKGDNRDYRMEAKLKDEIEKLRKQLSEAVNKLEVQNEAVGSMVQRIAELEEKDASRHKELEDLRQETSKVKPLATAATEFRIHTATQDIKRLELELAKQKTDTQNVERELEEFKLWKRNMERRRLNDKRCKTKMEEFATLLKVSRDSNEDNTFTERSSSSSLYKLVAPSNSLDTITSVNAQNTLPITKKQASEPFIGNKVSAKKKPKSDFISPLTVKQIVPKRTHNRSMSLIPSQMLASFDKREPLLQDTPYFQEADQKCVKKSVHFKIEEEGNGDDRKVNKDIENIQSMHQNSDDEDGECAKRLPETQIKYINSGNNWSEYSEDINNIYKLANDLTNDISTAVENSSNNGFPMCVNTRQSNGETMRGIIMNDENLPFIIDDTIGRINDGNVRPILKNVMRWGSVEHCHREDPNENKYNNKSRREKDDWVSNLTRKYSRILQNEVTSLNALKQLKVGGSDIYNYNETKQKPNLNNIVTVDFEDTQKISPLQKPQKKKINEEVTMAILPRRKNDEKIVRDQVVEWRSKFGRDISKYN